MQTPPTSAAMPLSARPASVLRLPTIAPTADLVLDAMVVRRIGPLQTAQALPERGGSGVAESGLGSLD